MQLTYFERDEGLRVEIKSTSGTISIHMTVTKRDNHVASAWFNTIEGAQAVARLLVGIEMQGDNASWRRGPRGPAYPTDKKGNRIVPSDLVDDEDAPPAVRNCLHHRTSPVGSHYYCDDCGSEVFA